MPPQLTVVLVTLFPGMLSAVADAGITRRAIERGLLRLEAVNPRDFATDRHRTVDDRPFGGGPGMVMKAEPLLQAVAAARQITGPAARVVYLSPQGSTLDQDRVIQLSQSDGLILVAGRYEGIDERFVELAVDEEISIGDYVLSGGELPALVLVDAMTRCLPGVLGDESSAKQDSFTGNLQALLDCPHYTRPEICEGQTVPEVLLGGNHQEIARWRRRASLGRTWQRRPDLLEARRRKPGLTDEDEALLAEFINSNEADSDQQ